MKVYYIQKTQGEIKPKREVEQKICRLINAKAGENSMVKKYRTNVRTKMTFGDLRIIKIV